MKGYESYKDSGVKWLGEIPSHWEIRPLKYCCSLKGRIGWKGLRSDEYQNSGYAYLVTGQDFIGSEIDWSKCYQISQERYSEDPYIQLNNGDMLITKDGTIGKVAKVTNLDKPACLNSGIFVIKQKDTYFNQGFLYWMLCSNVLKEFNVYTQTGATISHLYQNVFENMPCVLPSISEQESIASYLDTATAKIDEAIAQQQKMIDLLNERKQIIINNAVTKGLNTDVPMKDSGIDWIGEIPEHWKTRKLKYCAKTNSGSTPRNIAGKDNPSSTIRWVRTTDLNNDVVVDTSEYLSEKEMMSASCPWLPKGTVLISMYGGAGSFGKVGILGVEATINQALCSINCNKNIIPDYMRYYLQSVHRIWMKYAASSRKDPNLNQDIIRNLDIVLPPIEEQKTLIESIGEKMQSLTSVVEMHLRQISLLQERKQIIINDVVTGKIKVC